MDARQAKRGEERDEEVGRVARGGERHRERERTKVEDFSVKKEKRAKDGKIKYGKRRMVQDAEK